MGLVADSQGAKASAAATNWEEPPSAGEKCGHRGQNGFRQEPLPIVGCPVQSWRMTIAGPVRALISRRQT